ncbi:MAG: hypothetical protein HQ564_05095 [Candidatus Saganbacteria bacterium]|nr:hypothetical protein [Candidatus Saganbacteria bacterium]
MYLDYSHNPAHEDKGFSRRNVLNMRNFYLAYPKWQAVPAILSWTHILALLAVENKLFASKYRLSLPDKRLLQKAVERIVNREGKD